MKLKPHDTMVQNILKTYSAASDADMLEGMVWYSEAHQYARLLANTHNVTIEISAGVIAAVSPRLSWEKNKNLATRIMLDDENGMPLSGYMSAGLDKAQRILDGNDPFEVLNGQKTRAFYECIVHSGQTDIVCVDRHAMGVAYGCAVPEAEQGMTPKQYEGYAMAYRAAARILGVPAAIVQAVTWVAWRNR